MKRYGRPRSIVTDRLRSYRAAMTTIGSQSVRSADAGSTIGPKTHTNRSDDENERWRKFRSEKTLQKFAAAHASIENHFNQDRHLNRRDIFKQDRAAALAEWRHLAA